MKQKAVVVALAALLLASVALAANGYDLSWHVIGGGGGHSEADPYSLDATIGQAVVGVVSNRPYELCAGFWCSGEAGAQYGIYLPVLLKDYS